LYLQPVEEVLESTKRRIGRLVGRNSSDKWQVGVVMVCDRVSCFRYNL
jgi:hypothetical protein